MRPATSGRRLMLAAVLVIAVLGAAIVFMTRHRSTAARPAATAPSATAAGSGAPAPSPSLPSASPGARVILAGLRWADFGGVSLPVSPTAGPHDTRKGLAAGYADTPAGAVLAAVNIAVRATPQGGPGIFTPTISRQVTGPDVRALQQACAAAYGQAISASGRRYGQPLGPAYVVEQAYRLVSFAPAQATVDVASTGPGPQGVTVRAVTRVEVVWLRGDWHVVAPPGGDWAASATALTSLASFTLFPAASGG